MIVVLIIGIVVYRGHPIPSLSNLARTTTKAPLATVSSMPTHISSSVEHKLAGHTPKPESHQLTNPLAMDVPSLRQGGEVARDHHNCSDNRFMRND